MKFLILAAFIAVCTASSLSKAGRSILINPDGTVLINGLYGKKAVIGQEIGLNGQRNIDIVVAGPGFATKKFQIPDVGYGTPLQGGVVTSQENILFELFKEYQGVIDSIQYDKFLTRVLLYVQNGQIPEYIYDILQNLNVETPLVLNGIQSEGYEGLKGFVGVKGFAGQGYGDVLPWWAFRQQQQYYPGQTQQFPQYLNQLGYGQGIYSGLNGLGYGQGYGYGQRFVSGSMNPFYTTTQQYQQYPYINKYVTPQQTYGSSVSGFQGGIQYPTVPLSQSQSLLYNYLAGQSPVVRKSQVGGGVGSDYVVGGHVPFYGGVGLKEGYGYGQPGYLTPGVQQVVY